MLPLTTVPDEYEQARARALGSRIQQKWIARAQQAGRRPQQPIFLYPVATARGSDNMPAFPEVPPLVRSLKQPFVIFALLALLVAQAAAGQHAAKHFKAGGDAPGLPGTHTQLCLECASFAPLASAHGGLSMWLVVASPGIAEFIRAHDDTVVDLRHFASYRSRAPPR